MNLAGLPKSPIRKNSNHHFSKDPQQSDPRKSALPTNTPIASKPQKDKLETPQFVPVFISFFHFLEVWEFIPSETMFRSILVFGSVKESDVFPRRRQSTSNSTAVFLRKLLGKGSPYFLQVLRIKNKQGRVIWKPEISKRSSCVYDPSSSESHTRTHIDPLWKAMVNQLKKKGIALDLSTFFKVERGKSQNRQVKLYILICVFQVPSGDGRVLCR